MSNAGYWKWRAQAAKRLHEFDKLHPQVHALMAKSGWEVICQATEKEDKEEKWDWAMIKHPATDDEILGLVDIKFGGVRDDHVKYFEKHGKSHGVTHYAFGYRRHGTDKVIRVRVVTVEFFMKNKLRHVNSKSGEVYWTLKPPRAA
jgi:hypothetical protein